MFAVDEGVLVLGRHAAFSASIPARRADRVDAFDDVAGSEQHRTWLISDKIIDARVECVGKAEFISSDATLSC
jgi:hypothetical protein